MIRSPGQCAELHVELHSIIGVVQIRRNVQAQQSSLLFVEHERHGILLLDVIRNDNPHLIWNSGGPEHDLAALVGLVQEFFVGRNVLLHEALHFAGVFLVFFCLQ